MGKRDVHTGGTPLCADTNSVNVVNGLFSSEIYCDNVITGQQLHLGIEVASNGEMTPRMLINIVPYAWSLRPGAKIIGSAGVEPILHVETTHASGRGLRGYATSPTGTNYGVVGASVSPDGYGVYGYDNAGGTGIWAQSSSEVAVKAESASGVAIKADGTGVIQSSARSYMWISGNSLRPASQSDTTVIDLDNVGGARIIRNAASGTRNVMLPITITSPLYGQNIKVVGLDIYFVGQTDNDFITAVLLRRQTGVCTTDSSSCYLSLLHATGDRICSVTYNATGCTTHWDVDTNNTLSASSGILYLTIELDFSSSTSYVRIGGARLTLEHD